jgi:hypothetical protein
MTVELSAELIRVRSLLTGAIAGSDGARKELSLVPYIERNQLSAAWSLCRAEGRFDEAHWFAERLAQSGDPLGVECLVLNAPDCIASSYVAGLHFRRRNKAEALRLLSMGAQKGHILSKKELAQLRWGRSILGKFILTAIRTKLTVKALVIFKSNEHDWRIKRGLFE